MYGFYGCLRSKTTPAPGVVMTQYDISGWCRVTFCSHYYALSVHMWCFNLLTEFNDAIMQLPPGSSLRVDLLVSLFL